MERISPAGFARIKKLLQNPVIFDGRNIYDLDDLQRLGFKYYSIGRHNELDISSPAALASSVLIYVRSFSARGTKSSAWTTIPPVRKPTSRPFLKNPRFRFIDHNVSRYIEVPEPLDYVLHFASPASPVDYLELPIPTLKVGALGTHNALGLAKAKGAVFLLASTSEVYGDPLVRPQSEEYWGNVNPDRPARRL